MKKASGDAIQAFRQVEFDVVGSTNTEALRLARQGETGPVWVTARTQDSGRGRRGRHWVSPPGNLYASLLLVDPAPPQLAPQLAFVTALAAHDAVADLAPALRSRLALKWPNDLLVDGAKLVGILIESEFLSGLQAVAIGIGINCLHHPTDSEFPATDLSAQGEPRSPQAVLQALATAMTLRLAEWDRGASFLAIRDAWLSQAQGRGQPIRVRMPNRERFGIFEGIDSVGRLMLGGDGGVTELIEAGDVFAWPAPAVCERRP